MTQISEEIKEMQAYHMAFGVFAAVFGFCGVGVFAGGKGCPGAGGKV